MVRNEFKNALIALSLALSGGPIVFAATPATVTQENPTNDDIRAAYLAHEDELNNIQANRQSIIKDIVKSWANEPSVIENVANWEKEITAVLNKASKQQLFLIQNAKSYSEVLGILQGDQHALRSDQQLLSVSSANDLIAPASLGDVAADLVFTPVFPCRIFDTRLSQGGTGPYGDGEITSNQDNTRDYLVHGTGGQIGPQGGNKNGCPAPNGEPSAISANFTVVPIENSGHITAYPYGGVLPTASFVNYYPGTNIANSGIIQTAYLKAYDLSVYHGSLANSLADVMGYFYPATPSAAFTSGHVGSLISSPLNAPKRYSFGYSVKITTTTNNQKVFWTAHQPVGTVSAASNLSIWPCWKASADPDVPASWKLEGGGSFGITMTGTQRNIVSSSAVVAPGVGDHDFGLCYSTDNTQWTFNDWGYVAAQRNP